MAQNSAYQYSLLAIPFGSKAKGVLDGQRISYSSSLEDCGGNKFVIIVTDDAAQYEAEINETLSVVGFRRPCYLVVDLSETSDTEKCRKKWKHYNKVKDGQTVRNLVRLVEGHLIHPSMIAFDNHDLLGICSQGEHLESIYLGEGVDGLKTTDVPASAKAVACGIGIIEHSIVTLEQMNEVNDFFEKFGGSVEIKWSISAASKTEVIIIYSYNK